MIFDHRPDQPHLDPIINEPSRLEVVQFCVTLPLAGGSDAVAAGEGFLRARESVLPLALEALGMGAP